VRFLGGKHRVLVRQINAAHATGREFCAYGLGLFAVTYQNRDIGGPQTTEGFCVPDKSRRAGLPTVEQCGDFAGTGRRQLLAIDRP